ncbi:MAG: phytanoyl-CoA dioxygenase family protein [Rubrivivax sp.]|nr:phytanoyl-CoA dioxygenase family protein [Rubrivivax sp.]
MLTPDQIRHCHDQGFLVLPGFHDAATLAAVRDRSLAIVDAFDAEGETAVFSSRERALTSDAALIASGSGVHCFFETEAFGADGRLNRDKQLAVNKIGHAMHDLDPVFHRFFRDPRGAAICAGLGLQRPLLWQSQVIFKPPGIGGEVRWHQDASFFDTTPQTVTTFWYALEDATRDNGCLWVQPGGHRGPLRERFVRDGDRLQMEALDDTPWPTTADGVPLEVPAGTLVVFHGLLPHGSAANRSAVSRLACTLHVTDGAAAYSPRNWLQRTDTLPVRGF